MKKIAVIGIITALIVCLCAVVMILFGGGKTDNKLKLAEKYIQDGRYEEAILEYQTAIEIDPRNKDAYTGLVKAYIFADNDETLDGVVKTVGDWLKLEPYDDKDILTAVCVNIDRLSPEKAYAILEAVYNMTGSDMVKQKMEEISKIINGDDTADAPEEPAEEAFVPEDYLGEWEYYTRSTLGDFGDSMYFIRTIDIQFIDKENVTGVVHRNEISSVSSDFEDKEYSFSAVLQDEDGTKCFDIGIGDSEDPNKDGWKMYLVSPDYATTHVDRGDYDRFYFFKKKGTTAKLSDLTFLDEVYEQDGNKWMIVETSEIFHYAQTPIVPVENIVKAVAGDNYSADIEGYKGGIITIDESVPIANAGLELDMQPDVGYDFKNSLVFVSDDKRDRAAYAGTLYATYYSDADGTEYNTLLIGHKLIAYAFCDGSDTIYPDKYPQGLKTGEANVIGQKIVYAIKMR